MTVRGLVTGWRQPLVDADALGISSAARAQAGYGSTDPDAPVLGNEHPLVVEATRLAHKFGGVIFTGPPGTGKTFIAHEAARLLTDGDKRRQWKVQFHASYSYEDFMMGYRPVKNGFEPWPGPFYNAVDAARRDPEERPHVLVIDELSRADVGRVFGEALTYIDRSQRKKEFLIPFGETLLVPDNLLILATMNPQDRGVDEVDAAFERRFAKMRMDPDPDALDTILAGKGVDDVLRQGVLDWFKRINGLARKNPAASVGHAYFATLDTADLRQSFHDVWEYQLKFLVERAFRLQEKERDELIHLWEQLFTAGGIVADDVSAADTPTDLIDGGDASGATLDPAAGSTEGGNGEAT